MATGTKLMQEISDQFLNCKICGENFKEPKTLTCLHTFCQACLQERHDKEATSRSGRYSIYLRHVTCPLCEKKTELPSGGVRRLPSNFLVSNLTDVLAKRTVASVPPCEICTTVKGKTVSATNKCLDCCKLLCTTCVDMHRSTKVTQQHSLIDLQEEKNVQCKVHEDEQVRYYCSACDACICVVCAFQDHRDHDVCSFNEVSDRHRGQLEGLLSECRGRLDDVTSKLDKMTAQEVKVREAKDKIHDLAIEYIAQVRVRERELMKQLDELCGGDVQRLCEGKSALQEYRADLESSCCLTEVMLRQKGVELLLVKGDIEVKMAALLKPTLPEVQTTETDLSELNFVPGKVALGDISLKTDPAAVEESKHTFDSTYKACVLDDSVRSTPDVINSPAIETKETSTTMVADMSVTMSHSDCQTDQKNCFTAREGRDIETRERGVTTSSQSVRARGTMTERSDVSSLKCQTDTSKDSKVSQTEKNASSTHSSSEDQSVSPISPRQEPRPAPDLLPPSSLLYNPGRRIWSRRVQTDISSLGSDGLCDLSNEDFVKLMTLTQKRDEEPPPSTPRRARRVRTREKEILTDVSGEIIQKPRPVVTCSVSTQSDDPPKRMQTDQETSTPTVHLESRGVWTDQTAMCDRASDAIWPKRQDRAVGTVAVRKDHFSQQASPKTSTAVTNTIANKVLPQETQTEESAMNQIAGPNDLFVKQDVKKQLSKPSSDIAVSVKQTVKTLCDRGCDPIVIPKPSKATETLKIRMSTAATETTAIKTLDKDVSTTAVKTIDEWTETDKPQMVNTGVAPPRPLTQEVGMSTIAVLTTEEATCTEFKSYRDTHTEMVFSVCDQETLTEKLGQHDAQTGMDIEMETEGCGTDTIYNTEEGSMTDFSQLDTTEEDTTFYDTESAMDPAAPCALCGHTPNNSNNNNNNNVNNNKSICDVGVSKHSLQERSSNSNPSACNQEAKSLVTQDVGTMAMSCASYKSQLQDMGVQTLHPRLCDKASATSLEWNLDDLAVRPLSKEHLDAATSTESLPYIGLLSEIDVDELIVIPEAAFELVSDEYLEADRYGVTMVDRETCMDSVQCVEEGTQTRCVGLDTSSLIASGDQSMTDSSDRKGIGEVIKTLVSQNSTDQSSPSSSVFGQYIEGNDLNFGETTDTDKHLVSIGVNTVPKMTFEKETCTPMRHLFSKGTSTFYVSKMDKSTSMLNQRASLELCKSRSVDKVTMTTQMDKKDIGVETESAKMDGRINACISKLRNVSERLASPTSKKGPDEDVFFGSSFPGPRPATPRGGAGVGGGETAASSQPHCHTGKSSSSGRGELARQRQVKNLLGLPEGPVVTKKERKPQPITTLKGRRPAQPPAHATSEQEKPKQQNENSELRDRTQSLPRRFPGERSGVVRMGSQPLPASRLPLLRYNSAPGRIATVPTQTLINKCAAAAAAAAGSGGLQGESPVPRPVSPSKIPVTKKKSPSEPRGSPIHLDKAVKDEKPQMRHPALPSITETRNSTCSDSSNSSFVSATSATPMHTPTKAQLIEEGFTPEVCSTPKVAHKPRPQVDTLSVASAETGSSKSTSTRVSPTTSMCSLDRLSGNDTTRSSTDTLDIGSSSSGKQEGKKEKKSFMQRLLSKKKKSSDSSKKSDKKAPPVCVPTINTQAVAASLANAPPPKVGPAPPVEHQPHWPQLQLPPHHYTPEVPKPASPPRKPRPFVIVNQRVVSIQQDNVEEVAEKIEKRRASIDQGIVAPSSPQVARGQKEKKVEKEPAASARAPQKSPKVPDKAKRADKSPLPKGKKDVKAKKTQLSGKSK